MRIRFDAMTRRPASSSALVTAPVRLRRVASGLMIEKVRVTAMGCSGLSGVGIGRAPSRSCFLRPAPVLQGPVIALDAPAPRKQLPGQTSALQRVLIEQI